MGAFGLTEANLRRYTFVLEELKDVEEALKEKIVPVVRRGSPDEVALGLVRNASMIVCDMSYLRLHKEWR